MTDGGSLALTVRRRLCLLCAACSARDLERVAGILAELGLLGPSDPRGGEEFPSGPDFRAFFTPLESLFMPKPISFPAPDRSRLLTYDGYALETAGPDPAAHGPEGEEAPTPAITPTEKLKRMMTETEMLEETGDIDPAHVMTPSIFVDRIVVVPKRGGR